MAQVCGLNPTERFIRIAIGLSLVVTGVFLHRADVTAAIALSTAGLVVAAAAALGY
jgi:hypothetical protein